MQVMISLTIDGLNVGSRQFEYVSSVWIKFIKINKILKYSVSVPQLRVLHGRDQRQQRGRGHPRHWAARGEAQDTDCPVSNVRCVLGRTVQRGQAGDGGGLAQP